MLAHERLLAWQLCHELVLAVYDATTSFPKHELYGLTSQARRAAFSAAVNIAEGSAKRGSAEFRRFIDISVRLARRACLHSTASPRSQTLVRGGVESARAAAGQGRFHDVASLPSGLEIDEESLTRTVPTVLYRPIPSNSQPASFQSIA